jgi:hypothetical protein
MIDRHAASGFDCIRLYVPENPSWNVAAAANGDHEIRLEVIDDANSRFLTQLMDLEMPNLWLVV